MLERVSGEKGMVWEEFFNKLIDVRYKDGTVEFHHRKHFLTDWAAVAPPVATDITKSLGPNSIQVSKHLNQKGAGEVYLAGLPEF